MRTSRPVGVWIGILAVLMQLLLPQVHAAAYAERSSDPLAYALCSIGATPGLAAELRDILPAEVVDALDGRHAAPDLPDCHACVGAHAGAAVETGQAPLPQASPDSIRARSTVEEPAHTRDARRPPVRGPPLSA